jgi:23S rRNA (adenine-N6)-dimethyltransferase
VLDVGAGTGAITAALVAAGARVIAVELHPARAASLRTRFAGRGVTVVQADAANLRLPRRPFKVVANPPFALTTAVLRRLTSSHSRLERGVLVLPTWAVARWANGRGTSRGGRLSTMGSGSSGRGLSHDRFSFAAGLWLPPQAFTPSPPSPARVLEVSRRQGGHRR